MPAWTLAFRRGLHDMPTVDIDDIDDLSVGRGCTTRQTRHDLWQDNATDQPKRRLSARSVAAIC